jgi:hypothetical protein
VSIRGLDLGTTAQIGCEACTRPLSQISGAGDQGVLALRPKPPDRAKPQPILNRADVPLVEVEEFGWCCATSSRTARSHAISGLTSMPVRRRSLHSTPISAAIPSSPAAPHLASHGPVTWLGLRWAWEEAGGGVGDFHPDTWDRIAAGLKTVKLRDIMNATGLSESFASTVRSGRWRLHVSHWPALAALAEPTAQTR